MKKRSGFSSIHSAAGMKRYLDQKIQSEVERNKPQVRTATVVSIDRKLKKCEVRYPGEEGTVRVPYGNAEPAAVGSRVKIDGPVGDRRIVDVVGRTRTQARIETLESRRWAAPMWAQSTYDYAETYPIRMIPGDTTPPRHNSTQAHCSLIIMPSDMQISRIESKIRTKPSQNLHLSRVAIALHRVNLTTLDADDNPAFGLQHIAHEYDINGDVPTDTWRFGHTLSEPHQAYAGEVYAISIASYNNSTANARHPIFETVSHPTVPQTLGNNQFTWGWYDKSLMSTDVLPEQISKSLTSTVWAAAFPLPPGQGYVDSGGGGGEEGG